MPRITKKDRPFTEEHLREFETYFEKDPNGRAKRDAKDSQADRWRRFGITEVKERDFQDRQPQVA